MLSRNDEADTAVALTADPALAPALALCEETPLVLPDKSRSPWPETGPTILFDARDPDEEGEEEEEEDEDFFDDEEEEEDDLDDDLEDDDFEEEEFEDEEEEDEEEEDEDF